MQTISNRYYQDSIANPFSATAAKEKIESALTGHGSRWKAGKWTCPACGHQALVLYPASVYSGTYLKCHAGCPETAVLGALGLDPYDRFDVRWEAYSPVRDTIITLRKTPVQWFSGTWTRNEHILYNACLSKAWTLNSLEFSYARRVAAADTGLSQWVTGRTFLELSMLGLITPTGSTPDKHAKGYRLVTDYQGPRLADDIPQGVNNRPYKNKSTKPLPPLTGSFPVWLFFDPCEETRAWLRATGMAVVRVMSREPKPLADIIRESGVSKNTARKILRTMLAKNGLAEESGKGWRLTGDLAGFHPGTDILGRRADTYRRERESYDTHLEQRKARYDRI